MMKKIVPLLLALLLLPYSAFAAGEAVQEKMLFELKEFGILVGDESGDIHLDDPVTRAECCKMLTRLMGLEQAAQNGLPAPFSDVPQNYWASNYIGLMARLGVINGTGGGLFHPDDTVTLPEAAKMLVGVLGYDVQAREKGYPNGYMMTAASLGLLKNVKADGGGLTRGDMAGMVYQALDVDLLEQTYAGAQAQYEVIKGNTYREVLLIIGGEQKEKRRGIVTATIDCYLLAPQTNIEENQAEIGGILYQLDDGIQVRGLVGQCVEFYTYEDEATGKSTISSLRPIDSRVIEIDVEDIKSASRQSVSYYGTESREEKVSLDSPVVFVYNNRVIDGFSAEELQTLKCGTLRLVDNNKNDAADYVFIDSYETILVEQYIKDDKLLCFQNGYLFDGKRTMDFSFEDSSETVVVVDASGSDFSLENLKKNDVVSILASKDGSYKKLIVTQNQVQGTVSEVTDEEVLLDGQAYEWTLGADMAVVQPGDSVTLYLDHKGKIASAEVTEEGSMEFGYVLDVGTRGAMGTEYEAKLLLAGQLKEKEEEVEDENDFKNDTTKVLVAKNKDVVVLPLKQRIQAGDESLSGSGLFKLKNKAVKFSRNAAGEISRIEYPEQITKGENVKRKYNTYERTFGGTSGGAFGVDENTYVVCLPEGGATREEDYRARVQMNDGKQYSINAYEQDKTTDCAKFVVITEKMNFGASGTITTSNKVGFVAKTTNLSNEEGQPYYKVEMATEDEMKTIETSVDIANTEQFRQLKRGDLIHYSLDGDEKMDGYELVESFATLPDVMLEGENGEKERFMGYIVKVDYHYVSESLNRWVNGVSVSQLPGGQADKIYEVQYTNTPLIVIYDTALNETSVGKLENISENGNRIYVYTSYSKIKAVILIR